MEIQTSNRVLMIRPATFYFNAETAENNSFQIAPTTDCKKSDIHRKAIAEFDGLVSLLRNAGVSVEVLDEQPEPTTSDSVFPNNWISFHSEQSDIIGLKLTSPENIVVDEIVPSVNTTIVLYPMWSKERRTERMKLREEALKRFFPSAVVLDLSPLENEEKFLEGTGSMVMDRVNKIAYACLSPRTSREAVELFGKRMGYKTMTFSGVDSSGKACYHTNVMISVADKYSIICLEAIADLGERVEVEVSLQNSGKVVIPITMEQMNNFTGNCLQLRGSEGTFLVMSTTAHNSLTEEQIDTIQQFDKILHANVETIERYGGGSVRCMIAEMGEVEEPATSS